MQNWTSSQASPEVPVNENFAELVYAETYAKKASTTSGLTWGYWGGRWGGVSIADGTLSLTNTATNYLVVAVATGVQSVSTSATNWNDQVNYVRVYKLTTAGGVVTATEDHRGGVGGVHGRGYPSTLVPDEGLNNQTGTSYTYLTGDKGKLVTHSNAASIAGTLPQASVSFPANWWMDVQNRGAGTLTITPTTSTIDGLTALALTTGQGARIVSDGTNYFTFRGAAAAGSGATLSAQNTFTANQVVAPSTLTSGASIAVNAALSNNFKVTLAHNATLANPTNLVDGMILNFRFKQDGTGGRTLAYGSKYKFPAGVVPVLSTAIGAVDFMSGYYDSGDDTISCSMLKAFA